MARRARENWRVICLDQRAKRIAKLKFFPPEVYESFSDHASYKKVHDEYLAYLEGLSGILPQRVLDLAKVSGTHDGLVVRVDHDRDENVVKLVLRCGHIQMGYYNLVLTYKGATILPDDDATLAKIARATLTRRMFRNDLCMHELDRTAEGEIEHRFMFHNIWPPPESPAQYVCFTIRCRELTWRCEPKRTRRLPPLKDRYPGGPGTPRYA